MPRNGNGDKPVGPYSPWPATRWHREAQPEEITYISSPSGPSTVRRGILPESSGFRSSKRAIAAGMRAGGMAWRQVYSRKDIAGDCDKIRKAALDYAETYMAAEPELIELHDTHPNRRPPTLRDEKVWHDVLNDRAEAGAYKVIEQEWFRMKCAPGKKIVVLPWDGMRRRRRCCRRG